MATKVFQTIILLLISNVFMTLAWYGHLKLSTTGTASNWPLYVVILLSWGVALIEYMFMIPANKIGFNETGGPFTLIQLKVIQECISLGIFTAFTLLVFKTQHLHWNHYVSFLLLVLAVFFAFLNNKP